MNLLIHVRKLLLCHVISQTPSEHFLQVRGQFMLSKHFLLHEPRGSCTRETLLELSQVFIYSDAQLQSSKSDETIIFLSHGLLIKDHTPAFFQFSAQWGRVGKCKNICWFLLLSAYGSFPSIPCDKVSQAQEVIFEVGKVRICVRFYSSLCAPLC